MVYGEVIVHYQRFLASDPNLTDDFVVDFLPLRTHHSGYTLGLFKRFVRVYFANIHSIICDDKKLGEVEKGAGVARVSVPVGLSAWIMSYFEVTEPVALGVAAYLSIILFEATRGSFCEMTKEQIERIIKEKEENIKHELK